MRRLPFPPDLAVALSARSVQLLRDTFPALAALDLSNPLAAWSALLTAPLDDASFPADAGAALDDVALLATDLAREAILEAMRDRGRDPRRWEHKAPLDLAVHLVCAAGRRKRWARAVLARARIRVARHFAARASYEVLARSSDAPTHGSILDAARLVHGDDRVDAIEVSGTYAEILYRAPAVRVPTVAKGAVRARVSRPIACDVVRWDRAARTVSFTLARPSQLLDWMDALGRACMNDPGFLLRRPALTLKAIHEGGVAFVARAELPAGVSRVTVIACEAYVNTRHRARGDTALADLHAAIGAGRGYMQRATLRLAIDGVPHPVDATIELPGKITLSHPRYEPELRGVMRALEITSPGSLPDDLVSLAPWEHPAWRWIEALGAATFEAARAAKILVPSRSRRPGDERDRMWGALLGGFPIPGEKNVKYAVGEDLAARARTVDDAAFDVWTLDRDRLARALRERAQLGELRADDVPDALLPIGELKTTSARTCFFTLVRAVDASEAGKLARRARRACKGAHVVVFVTKGRSLGGALPEVEVTLAEQMGACDLARAVVEAAEEVGVDGELEASRFATAERPLVLIRQKDEAWIGNVRLLITDKQVALLFALAEEPGVWITAVDLGIRISPGAGIPDQIVRKTRADFDARVRDSFVKAGVPIDEEIVTKLVESHRTRGYRLGVGVVVR